MTDQPPPLRCDKSCNFFGAQIRTGLHECKSKNCVSGTVANYERRVISKRGCASHSASSQQRIEQQICNWKQDDEGNWHTGCGYIFVIMNDDSPLSNRFVYCPYCGALLRSEQHG